MRKLLIVLVVAILAAGAALATASCSNKAAVPGAVWANEEVAEYQIIRDNVVVGAMVIRMERLPAGSEVTLNATGETYSIGSSAHGTRVTVTASDSADPDNVWLYAESIMDRFTSVASYRKMNYGGENYELKAHFSGKYYYYTLNGGKEERIRVGKSGFLDREHMFTIVRCYDIEAGYSGSYKIADPFSGEAVKISVAAAGEVAFSNPVEVVDFAGNSETRATTLCTAVTFSRTETPQGKPVTVLYSKADGLEAKGDPASSDAAGGTGSVRVPVQIIENDVTYNLVRISAK